MKKTDYHFKFVNQRIKSSSFSLDDKFSLKESFEILPELKFGYLKSSKNKAVIVEIGIRLPKGQAPFTFEAITEGIFQFEKMPIEADLERICCVNCGSILFPFLREFIADLTRRAGLPPCLIPPVNFVEFFNFLKQGKKPSLMVKKEK